MPCCKPSLDLPLAVVSLLRACNSNLILQITYSDAPAKEHASLCLHFSLVPHDNNPQQFLSLPNGALFHSRGAAGLRYSGKGILRCSIWDEHLPFKDTNRRIVSDQPVPDQPQY